MFRGDQRYVPRLSEPVALAGAAVVALAWGPAERRTKALALVPRIAWGAAGLVVLLAIVGATRPFWLVSHPILLCQEGSAGRLRPALRTYCRPFMFGNRMDKSYKRAESPRRCRDSPICNSMPGAV